MWAGVTAVEESTICLEKCQCEWCSLGHKFTKNSSIKNWLQKKTYLFILFEAFHIENANAKLKFYHTIWAVNQEAFKHAQLKKQTKMLFFLLEAFSESTKKNIVS